MVHATDIPSGVKQLLVASDLSPRADRAVVRAIQLAKEHQALLTVLHVAPGSLSIDTQQAAALDHELRQRIRSLAALPEDSLTLRVTAGEPFVEVIRCARDVGADLTVVGAHGAQFLKDMIFGATAEKIVRNGDRSVLVVNQPLAEPYQRLIVAVDFSEESRRALTLAQHLAPQAHCRVLHVYEGYEAQLRRANVTEAELTRHRFQRRKDARKQLETFLQAMSLNDQPVKRIVKEGVPYHAIIHAAKRVHADLLVVGTTGRSGLPYLLLGSVAERVVREASCDVLVVRSGPMPLRLP